MIIRTQAQRNRPTANRDTIADEYWNVKDSHSSPAPHYKDLDLEPANCFSSVHHPARTSRSLEVPCRKLASILGRMIQFRNTHLVDHLRPCAFVLMLKQVWWIEVPSSVTSVLVANEELNQIDT